MELADTTNAIVAYEGRPTAAVEAILNQVVSSGTQDNYANHNIDLILWLYEKRGFEGRVVERFYGGAFERCGGEGKERNESQLQGSFKWGCCLVTRIWRLKG